MNKQPKTAVLIQALVESQADDCRELMDFYLAQMADLDDKIKALQDTRDARGERLNRLIDTVVKTFTDTMTDARRNDADMFDQIIADAQNVHTEFQQRLDAMTGTVKTSRVNDEAVTNVKSIGARPEVSEAA